MGRIITLLIVVFLVIGLVVVVLSGQGISFTLSPGNGGGDHSGNGQSDVVTDDASGYHFMLKQNTVFYDGKEVDQSQVKKLMEEAKSNNLNVTYEYDDTATVSDLDTLEAICKDINVWCKDVTP